MKKYLIITSNVGGRDHLWANTVKFDNCDYLYFTDSPLPVEGWDKRKSFQFSTVDIFGDRRNAKLYKVLASVMFPGYEYIIWHDSHTALTTNPDAILSEYTDFDFLLFKHPDRACIYDEMTHVAGLGRSLDIIDNIYRQFKFYEAQGMPRKYGLHEMTMFFVKPGHFTNQLMLMWWEQICKFGSRDQFSFDYCLWKHNNKIKIEQFKGQVRDNKYFMILSGHAN